MLGFVSFVYRGQECSSYYTCYCRGWNTRKPQELRSRFSSSVWSPCHASGTGPLHTWSCASRNWGSLCLQMWWNPIALTLLHGTSGRSRCDPTWLASQSSSHLTWPPAGGCELPTVTDGFAQRVGENEGKAGYQDLEEREFGRGNLVDLELSIPNEFNYIWLLWRGL